MIFSAARARSGHNAAVVVNRAFDSTVWFTALAVSPSQLSAPQSEKRGMTQAIFRRPLPKRICVLSSSVHYYSRRTSGPQKRRVNRPIPYGCLEGWRSDRTVHYCADGDDSDV